MVTGPVSGDKTKQRGALFGALLALVLTATALVAIGGTRPAVAQGDPTFVTTPGNDAGWVLHESTRQWVNPACRVELEAAGAEFTEALWATISSRPVTAQNQSCATLVDLLNPAETLLVTIQGNTAGWALHDDAKQWLSAACRAELEAAGATFAVVPWSIVGVLDTTTEKVPCSALSSSPPQPPPDTDLRLVTTGPTSTAGFVLDGISRQWISSTCRATLEALGREFAITPYSEIRLLSATYPNRTCDTIVLASAEDSSPPVIDLIQQAIDGTLEIDNHDRDSVQRFYQDIIVVLEPTSPEWTGDIGTCDAGTISSDYRRGALAMLNALREFAGDLGPVEFVEANDTRAMQSALIIEANQYLSHELSNTLDCWSPEGAIAAANSNIAIGYADLSVITDGYLLEPGDVNAWVGHRRWILDPSVQQLGLGASLWSNTIWVVDSSNPPVPDDATSIVTWPSPGYFPKQLVPDRWSFSLVAADLPPGCDQGCVRWDVFELRVLVDGVRIPVEVEWTDNTPILGPTMVFTMDSAQLTAETGDRVVDISVPYTVGGEPRTHSWVTTLIDTEPFSTTTARGEE